MDINELQEKVIELRSGGSDGLGPGHDKDVK
jgi:hypothetical protein